MTATESSQVDQGNLLIIGDLLIDRTIYCTVPKISPEAPVPVAMVEPNGIIETPGGAGLAASYASKNNLNSIFLTAVQKNRSQFLTDHKIRAYTPKYRADINPRKTRYIDVSSNHHLLRADTDLMMDESVFKSEEFINKMIEGLNFIIENYNIKGIVMLDYCKGIFDDVKIPQAIIETAKENGIFTYVDSRSEVLYKFRGADILKLNDKEFHSALNSGNLSTTDVEHIIITSGKDGAALMKHGKQGNVFLHEYKPDLSSYSGTPDVTGCGDVFDVTFCWYYCIKELSVEEAIDTASKDATHFAYQPIKERLTC